MIELNITLLIITFCSYLIGSISPAFLIGKYFFRKDIREFGSKNLGGSNAGRVLGKKIGIVVIVLDLLKGFIVVWITSTLTENTDYVILSGLMVILGHLLPLFTGFQGGKGVATTGGVLLFTHPILIPIGLLIIILFWLITEYESLAMLITYTILLVLTLFTNKIAINIVAAIVYIAILYAHRNNIIAIFQKTEKKKNNIFSKFE